MNRENNKVKLLALLRLLYEQTDASHGLTMTQIIEELAALGVDAERKGIYRDLDTLREFGFRVDKLPTRPVSYALMERLFSPAELMLLVDAVQSSRFLTERMANRLTGRLYRLGPNHAAAATMRQVHVPGRIRMQNESVFANVNIVQQAIADKRKVRFYYVKYDANKQPQRQGDGRMYCETPVQLVYTDGCYYMIAFNEHHESFPAYRLDRMVGLRESHEAAAQGPAMRAFDPKKIDPGVFSMFGGQAQPVELLVDAAIVGSMIDRFGKDVEVYPCGADQAHVHVKVVVSRPFFGWLAQFGTAIKLEKPAAVAQEYAAFLREIADMYSGS